MQMGNTFSAIGRFAAVTAVSLMTLYTGAHFMVKDDDTGVALIDCSGTGCIMGVSLTVQGTKLSTGATLTQASTDNRYIRRAGNAVQSPSMTGALVIQGANVVASGAIITANATISGVLSVDGATSFQENVTLSNGADLSMTGAAVSATGSTRRYVVLHSGSGTSAATGVNVLGGFQSPIVGSITQVKCYVGEAGNNGLTSFDVTAGGTSVTSTNCTVDATEVSSTTAATPPVVDTANNSLTEGELIKVDMNSPSTTSPITFAVELTIDVTTFP
jgi:hypothetical protein|tara:strand:+ start:4343 stop:5164 length:822 start_codon:yes stop_codon:yes gene_type:complete